jgi:hypothetical protein
MLLSKTNTYHTLISALEMYVHKLHNLITIAESAAVESHGVDIGVDRKPSHAKACVDKGHSR